MKLSSLEEYGLRCALTLARSYGEHPLSSSKIAEQEGISIEYVSKLMHLFRKSEVVLAVRGAQGGFKLAKHPEKITLKEVLEGVSGKDSETSFCNQYSGQKDVCTHFKGCSVRPVWFTLTDYFNDVLKSITLDTLLAKEEEVKLTVENVARSRALKIKSDFKPESGAKK